jgi:hypothetical protein
MQIKNHEDALYEAIYSTVIKNLAHICHVDDIDFIMNMLGTRTEFLKTICLLPYWFFTCCQNKNNIDLENELFILGKSNLQAWVAYTLYDYIRDGKIQKDKINLSLSVANIFHQKSIDDFYQLTRHDTNKIQVINNLLNSMDHHYVTHFPMVDIHAHFKTMCENSYRKSVGAAMVVVITTWLLGHNVGGKTHMHVLEFFKNYLNARQLSDDMDDMVDDMLNNIHTPATFLMRAQYGSRYIHMMMRSRINSNMKHALHNLRKISNFDYQKFTRLYVKEC